MSQFQIRGQMNKSPNTLIGKIIIFFLFVVLCPKIANCQLIHNPPQNFNINQLSGNTTIIAHLFNDSTKSWFTKIIYHYIGNEHYILDIKTNPKIIEELKHIYSKMYLLHRCNLDSNFFRRGIIKDDFLNKEWWIK